MNMKKCRALFTTFFLLFVGTCVASDLTDALLKAQWEEAARLVEGGADVNVHFGLGDETPLHHAVKEKRIEFVKLVLDMGAKVNERDTYGSTPLIRAAETNNTDVVELLLKKGADIKAKDKSGQTPLITAARKNNADVFELLLRKGADVTMEVDVRDMTVFDYLSSAEDGMKMFKLLLNYVDDLNKPIDERGNTLLHITIGMRNMDFTMDFTKLLLDRGAEVNVRDKYDFTPLHLAAGSGYTDIAELLLKKRADLNAKITEKGMEKYIADATAKMDQLTEEELPDLKKEAAELVGKTPLGLAESDEVKKLLLEAETAQAKRTAEIAQAKKAAEIAQAKGATETAQAKTTAEAKEAVEARREKMIRYGTVGGITAVVALPLIYLIAKRTGHLPQFMRRSLSETQINDKAEELRALRDDPEAFDAAVAKLRREVKKRYVDEVLARI